MDTSTSSITSSAYSFCGNRLPCGICRMTNSMCPLRYNGTSITWTCGDGPYTSSQTASTCTAQSGTTKATMNTEKE